MDVKPINGINDRFLDSSTIMDRIWKCGLTITFATILLYHYFFPILPYNIDPIFYPILDKDIPYCIYYLIFHIVPPCGEVRGQQ